MLFIWLLFLSVLLLLCWVVAVVDTVVVGDVVIGVNGVVRDIRCDVGVVDVDVIGGCIVVVNNAYYRDVVDGDRFVSWWRSCWYCWC